MLNNSTVSVIVPVYNNEKFVSECIESILQQTYKNIEIILVDDGSSDGSGAICDEYAKKDSRIKVFHQENGGVCKARNKGLEIVNGDYFCFVDSDDFIKENALEILMNDMLEYGSDMAIGKMGAQVQIDCPGHQAETEIWQDNEALIKSIEDNPFTYSSCGKLYKRKTFGDIRFLEGKKIHEDSFFVFQCFMKKPKVIVKDENIYCYRKNEESASHSEFSEKFFDILYFAEEKKKMIDKNFPDLREKANNIIVKANLAMLHAFCKADYRKYRKEIRKCIKTVCRLKKYFIPAIKGDLKWFWIIKHHLYGLFHLYYKLKY